MVFVLTRCVALAVTLLLLVLVAVVVTQWDIFMYRRTNINETKTITNKLGLCMYVTNMWTSDGVSEVPMNTALNGEY